MELQRAKSGQDTLPDRCPPAPPLATHAWSDSWRGSPPAPGEGSPREGSPQRGSRVNCGKSAHGGHGPLPGRPPEGPTCARPSGEGQGHL